MDSIGNCWSRHKVDKTPKSPLHAAYICWIGYRNSNIFKFQYADSRCLSLKPLPLHFAHLALASPCPASLSKTSPLPTAIPSWKALDAERKILQDPCADFWMFGCLVIPESWWFRDQNPTFLLISIAISVSCGIIFCLQSVGCFFFKYLFLDIGAASPWLYFTVLRESPMVSRFLAEARNPDNPLPSELAHTSPVPMDQKRLGDEKMLPANP